MAKEAWELAAFLKGLEGDAPAGAVDDAERLAAMLKVAGIPRITGATRRIELPKGIRIETLRSEPISKAGFAEEFEGRGIHVSRPYAQDLVDKIVLTGKPQDLELVWLSGRDLGLNRVVPYSQFLEAGMARGYNVLHPEVGLYLRLQDTTQPLGDWYWIAMEPIADRNGYPKVFVLEHRESGLWLNTDWTDLDRRWDPGYRLVFSASK